MSMLREYPGPIIDECMDRVYVGNRFAAQDLAVLRANGITHVVNASEFDNYHEDEGIEYWHIIVSDVPAAHINAFFNEVNSFVDGALDANETNRVFIHCRQGQSRSVTLTICYLMHRLHIPLQQAYEQCSAAHFETLPNFGFFGQLRRFETGLFPDSDPSVSEEDYDAFRGALNQLKMQREARKKRWAFENARAEEGDSES